MSLIELSLVDRAVRVECADHRVVSILRSIYGSLTRAANNPPITYRITPESSGTLSLARNGTPLQTARAGVDFLYNFDKDLIIESQKLRSDLYFVHGAVLASGGEGVALVAPSGFGKSTTTWGLMHHGFDYLSDELAPVDPRTMCVHAFPRALSLKDNPPSYYPLPSSAIYVERVTYLPTSSFPCQTLTQPLPLKTILFLRSLKGCPPPALRRLSTIDATVRLLANALNPLAHPANGLEVAVEITSKARCFELLAGDLRTMCDVVTRFFRPELGNSSVASFSR